jgi:transcription initiation factor TFIIE subunit alpha
VEQKQLQPLQVQLQRVKDLTPPDFGTLVQWEKRAIGSIRAGGESNEDPVKAAHAQGLTGTPMPFLGETKVSSAFREVACVSLSAPLEVPNVSEVHVG